MIDRTSRDSDGEPLTGSGLAPAGQARPGGTREPVVTVHRGTVRVRADSRACLHGHCHWHAVTL
jgi:hypothetical protein